MSNGFDDVFRQHSARRLAVAAKLHEIEAMPLSDEDLAMFAMFDREGYNDEQRRAYITDKIAARTSDVDAARVR